MCFGRVLKKPIRDLQLIHDGSIRFPRRQGTSLVEVSLWVPSFIQDETWRKQGKYIYMENTTNTTP